MNCISKLAHFLYPENPTKHFNHLTQKFLLVSHYFIKKITSVYIKQNDLYLAGSAASTWIIPSFIKYITELETADSSKLKVIAVIFLKTNSF